MASATVVVLTIVESYRAEPTSSRIVLPDVFRSLSPPGLH